MASTVTIRRPVTILLLLVVTASIALVTVYMSGKSYSKVDLHPFQDIRTLRDRTRPIATPILAVIVMPIIGNILLFVPWGFLTFIALYTVDRPTVQTYILTILLGFTFTLAIEAWQYFLPSRVVDVNDVIYNTLGTVLGALSGHLRLRVRFEFE